MLEKAHDYFSKLFKTAYHSILKSFRAFFPLFIAILLIESILFSVFLSFQNNISLRSEKIAKDYPHHIVVSGLNEEEMLLLRNDDRTVSLNDHCFDVTKTIKYESNAYDPTYTVYIKILTGNKNYGIYTWFIDDSLEANYEAMRYRYRDVFETKDGPNERLSILVTPLYTQEADANQLKLLCAFMMLVVSVLSAMIFYSLYCVYLNDKKFAFGIYAAFGATRRELRIQAMAELIIAAVFTILPSYYIASLLCTLIYQTNGSSFHAPIISLKNWLFILLWVAVVLYISLLLAMRTATQTEPMQLLSAEENTNPVSSTKRSFSLLGKRFPLSYELLSILRFRRHHLMLTLFSAFLSLLFVLGSYFSAVHTGSTSIRERTNPHFTLRFSNVSMLTQEYTSIIKKLDAIETAYALPNLSSAEDYAAFLRVPEENVFAKNNLIHDKENGIYYTGNACLYSGAFDIADYFSSVYTVSGAPSAFSSDPQNILIGKSVDNKDAFDFEVGDTVTLAVAQTDENGDVIYLDENAKKISSMTGRSFWKAAYENFAIHYYTFTVVGIIEDYPSGKDGTPIVMHPEVYEKITGQAPVIDQMQIRLAENAPTKTFLETESALRGIAARLGNCTVNSEKSFFENTITPMYCYAPLLRAISAIFLLFLPLTWLYSQALFFKKREKEFHILSAISAPLSGIRSLFLCNLLIVIPIALLSLFLSFSASHILRFFFERYMPSVLGLSDVVINTVSLSLLPYLIGFAVTLPSCFISLLISYSRYRKRYLNESTANEFQSGI